MDKTYKQDDSKKILAMIRKAIAQHRADIANKLNVDSPAVARNDRHGNPIIDKPNQQGGAHKRHTSVRQQFQKLHNEAAEDDKTDSGVGSDDPKASKGREKIDSKEKELDTKPVAKSGKTGDIVMYPDEKEYGNAEGAQKVMDTRAESFTEQYKAWLDEVRQISSMPRKSRLGKSWLGKSWLGKSLLGKKDTGSNDNDDHGGQPNPVQVRKVSGTPKRTPKVGEEGKEGTINGMPDHMHKWLNDHVHSNAENSHNHFTPTGDAYQHYLDNADYPDEPLALPTFASQLKRAKFPHVKKDGHIGFKHMKVG